MVYIANFWRKTHVRTFMLTFLFLYQDTNTGELSLEDKM